MTCSLIILVSLSCHCCKAKLRAGFEGIGLQYNDIVIACSPADEKVFANELKKILETIIRK